jgi:hypothetical protein
MDKIAQSLKKFMYTKEITKILTNIDPMLKNQKDLSSIFFKLLEKEIISENELMALQTKSMLGQFSSLMERNFQELSCGLYLYDEKEMKLWNASTSSVNEGYNEYTQGLIVENDIIAGDEVPVYVKGTVNIPNVERGEDITSLNHKRDLLKHGYRSLCLSPLNHNGHMIGCTVMYSKQIRTFTVSEMAQFVQFNKLIEEKLVEMKNQLLTAIKNSKMA